MTNQKISSHKFNPNPFYRSIAIPTKIILASGMTEKNLSSLMILPESIMNRIRQSEQDATGTVTTKSIKYTWKELYEKSLGLIQYEKQSKRFQQKVKRSKLWNREIKLEKGTRKLLCKPNVIPKIRELCKDWYKIKPT